MICMIENVPSKKNFLEKMKRDFVIQKYEYEDDDNMKFSLSFAIEFATKVDGKWFYKTVDKIIEFV